MSDFLMNIGGSKTIAVHRCANTIILSSVMCHQTEFDKILFPGLIKVVVINPHQHQPVISAHITSCPGLGDMLHIAKTIECSIARL